MTEARLARMAAAAEVDEAVERLDCCHSHLYDRGERLRRIQDELRADVDTRAPRAV